MAGHGKEHFISAYQLFSVLFIGRIIILVTINSGLAGNENFSDLIAASLWMFLATFVMVIPLWLLTKRRPTLNILDQGYYLLGRAGIILPVFYAIYFISVNWYYLSVFQLFSANVMDPRTPAWVIAAAVLVVACYGAYKGVEAIVRTAGIILVLICAGTIFMICSLFFKMDAGNFEPMFYEGAGGSLYGAILFLCRSSSISVMALLLPIVKGKRKLGFSIWNLGVWLVMTVVFLIMIGVAGDFLKMQIFPLYTVTAMAELGPFQRLDAVFLGVWLTGLFIKIAMDLYLVSLCVTRFLGEKAGRISILAGAAVTGIVAQLAMGSRELQALFFGPWLFFPITLTAAFLIPLFLLLMDKIQSKRRAGK